MQVWRLALRAHADLSGEGARIVGGRWNSPGHPMLYTSADAALALLEVRVHLDLPFDLLPDDFVLIRIETGLLAIEAMPLPSTSAECRQAGDQWLAEKRTPLLRVPSAVIAFSSNILINPRHPDSRTVSITAIEAYHFDPRLRTDGTP